MRDDITFLGHDLVSDAYTSIEKAIEDLYRAGEQARAEGVHGVGNRLKGPIRRGEDMLASLAAMEHEMRRAAVLEDTLLDRGVVL